MEPTLAEPQVGSREVKLEEAAGTLQEHEQ